MAANQYYVLFENASGYSLFLVNEFDEITKNFSAHANSFLKPIAFVPFISLSEALENVQAVNEGRVSSLLSDFLRQNLPVKDAVLGVADQSLGQAVLSLNIGFECIWDSSVLELLRVIRANSSRLLRSLTVHSRTSGDVVKKSTTAAQETAPGRRAERRSQLFIALSRARLQLDLVQHLADTGVVRSLDLLDCMDKNLAKSIQHLRVSYSLHFPELCRGGGLPGLDDLAFVSIVTYAPLLDQLVREKEQLIEWLGGDQQTAELIIELAKTSTGRDLSPDDVKILQQYGKFLLKLLKSRTQCCEMLERRVRSLVPNLTALMDQALPGRKGSTCLERVRKLGGGVSPFIIAARLLSHAVNLDKLAKMPSSRINSLGASKSLFQRSGAVTATAAGLLGRTVAHASMCNANSMENKAENQKEYCGTNPAISSLTQSVVEMSGGRLRDVVVRRRAARLLAAKSALAVRADCYRRLNPFTDSTADSTASHKLDSGEYGTALGQEAKRQLCLWGEANGVHLEKTVQELLVQREHRKRYRKAKRKAWIRRKLASGTNSIQNAESNGKEASICAPRGEDKENGVIGDPNADVASITSRKRCIDNEPATMPVKRVKPASKAKPVSKQKTVQSTYGRVLRSTTRASTSMIS